LSQDEESALSVPLRDQPLSTRRHKPTQPQPPDPLQPKDSAATSCPAAVDDPSEHLLADSPSSDLSLQQLASSLSADIVCLQEIFSSGCSSRWRTLLERAVERGQLGYSHVAFGRPSSLARLHLMDSGLAVLSRWPIRHQSFHPFVCNPGMLRFADKGFIHAVIEIGHKEGEEEASGFDEQGDSSCGASASASGSASSSASSSSRRLLHVFNTHLHPCEGSATAEAARDARRAQVQQLRAYMQAQGMIDPDPATAPTAPAAPAPPPGPASISSSADGSQRAEPPRASFIVLGDFNIAEGSVEHADLLRAWECAAAPLLGQPTQHMSHLFCNHGPLIAGDFAVARNLRWSQAEVVTQACALSDHFPVRYAASIS
jgi:endonuclease/exonuclease/phosphatase family metal-dependent hydrolase